MAFSDVPEGWLTFDRKGGSVCVVDQFAIGNSRYTMKKGAYYGLRIIVRQFESICTKLNVSELELNENDFMTNNLHFVK